MNIETLTPDQLRRELEDRGRLSELLDALLPIVRLRVGAVLRRIAWKGGCTRASDVDDFCQDALLELLENDARTLRGWNPKRGLTLPSFVQLVAERVTKTRLSRGFAQGPSDEPDSERPADSVEHPERRVMHRDELQRVLARLQSELSPRGLELFLALFIEERHVSAVCEDFALRPDAVYAWRSRLGKRIQAIADSLDPRP